MGKPDPIRRAFLAALVAGLSGAASSAALAQDAAIKVCGHCGAPNPGGQKICIACGWPLKIGGFGRLPPASPFGGPKS